jgi:hypothetical protein
MLPDLESLSLQILYCYQSRLSMALLLQVRFQSRFRCPGVVLRTLVL